MLVKGKSKARACTIRKSTGLKILVKGIFRKNYRTVARQALNHPTISSHIFSLIGHNIQKEMTVLCAKRTRSILRESSEEKLLSFSWDKLAKELETHSPTLFAILNSCVSIKRRRRKMMSKKTGHAKKFKPRQASNTMVLGIVASILLRHRNQHMNLIQRIVSLILHNGHSSKQV